GNTAGQRESRGRGRYQELAHHHANSCQFRPAGNYNRDREPNHCNFVRFATRSILDQAGNVAEVAAERELLIRSAAGR
ncbi:MAG: hypothetical protein WAM77_30285, partial [Xanthobacteraceae bacterium]